MEKDEFADGSGNSNGAQAASSSSPSLAPSMAPTVNGTVADFEEVEEVHELDAVTLLLMNATIIGCLLLAYYVRQYRIYYLPER